jgi:hypothetical protein
MIGSFRIAARRALVVAKTSVKVCRRALPIQSHGAARTRAQRTDSNFFAGGSCDDDD